MVSYGVITVIVLLVFLSSCDLVITGYYAVFQHWSSSCKAYSQRVKTSEKTQLKYLFFFVFLHIFFFKNLHSFQGQRKILVQQFLGVLHYIIWKVIPCSSRVCGIKTSIWIQYVLLRDIVVLFLTSVMVSSSSSSGAPYQIEPKQYQNGAQLLRNMRNGPI